MDYRWCIAASMCLWCGCTHLHNQKNEDLAREALQNFNDFKKISGGPYGAMLRNHVQMDAASAAFQAEVAKIKRETITAGLAGKTWSVIKSGLEESARQQTNRLESLAKELEQLAGEKTDATNTVDRVKKSLVAAQKKLNEANDEQQKWEARQTLFLSAIKMSAQLVASTNKPDLNALKKSGEDALNQDVIVERFDKDGKVTTVTNKVSEILKGDADLIKEGRFGDILTNYTYGLFDPKAAPGIRVTIFSLGMDLAQKQLERAKLEVANLQERIAIAREKQQLLTGNESIDPATALTILNDRFDKHSLTNPMVNTLEQLRPDTKNASALRDAFRVVATYAFLKSVSESPWTELSTRAAFLAHRHSIKLSAINAAEHEALISRGLQGLLIYHQGGLTEERIANFLRTAQTAAMAYIGTQVD